MREGVNEEHESRKNLAQLDEIFNISLRTSTSLKKNLVNIFEVLCMYMQEFRRNVQDSKIIVKKVPKFWPNSRPRSHNSFSSFNPPHCNVT